MVRVNILSWVWVGRRLTQPSYGLKLRLSLTIFVQMCDQLPFPLADICSSSLAGKIGEIIDQIVNNNLQPQEVCELFKLCPVDESPGTWSASHIFTFSWIFLVLRKITTVTGNGGDCGMLLAFGWITVEVVGTNYESCSTESLDNDGHDDLNPG